MDAPVIIEAVDINAILKTLPHRYPMLLIDRVINIRSDYSGIGIKNVTINEPSFQGHFPERPVYPGVMMIEAMAQTAGVIGILSIEGTQKPRAVYFLTIDKCKFRKPVLPGDTADTLAERVLVQEHRIYPLALRCFCSGAAGSAPDAGAALINPIPE